MTPVQLQIFLNRAGADPLLQVDGKIGPKTRQAVRDFQKKAGLRVSLIGAVDDRTITALMRAAAAAPSAKLPEVEQEHVMTAHHEAPPWLIWARQELGEKEVPGPKSNERILEYRDISMSADEGDGDDGAVPWCAIFVNAALEASGIHGSRSALARSFEHDEHFVRLDGPALGAITLFWRKSHGSGLGHVTLYDHETDDRVYGLGGNQGDEVSVAGFLKDGETFGLLGYFWPRGYPLPITGPIHEGQVSGRSDVSMV